MTTRGPSAFRPGGPGRLRGPWSAAGRPGRPVDRPGLLEDLTQIRARVTARGADARHRLSGGSFGQFRAFVEYKARIAGVPVVAVDPAHTSQTCAACGYCDHADRNAARNIRARAIVMVAHGVGTPDHAATADAGSYGHKPLGFSPGGS